MVVSAKIETAARSIISEAFSEYFSRFKGFSTLLASFSDRRATSAVFSIYRENFFYRTETTMAMLAALLFNVLDRPTQSEPALKLIGMTIADELGLLGGSTHKTLLERSHNVHARRIFNLPEIRLADSHKYSRILSTVTEYRKVQRDLYTNTDLIVPLGAFLAQEGTANSMLKLFYEVFFEPFASSYADNGWDFEEVYAYFGAHIEGVEEEHAVRAQECVLAVCRTPHDLVLLKSSMTRFLNAQANLWDDIGIAFTDEFANRELVA